MRLNLIAHDSYLEGGVSGLNLEFGEDPDAVGEFHRLVQHVLTLHVSFGDRKHVVVAQLLGNRVCNRT